MIATRTYSQYAFTFVVFLAQIKQFSMFFSGWILHKNAVTFLKQQLFHQEAGHVIINNLALGINRTVFNLLPCYLGEIKLTIIYPRVK